MAKFRVIKDYYEESRARAIRRAFIALITIFLFGLLFLFSIIRQVWAFDYSVEQIADAIYLAEGGAKTKFPYGIKSLRYEDRSNRSLTKEKWARKICINTIRNNIKRFAGQNEYSDFLEFLGSRYCPTTIKSEYHLNKNWVSNVRYFLNNTKGGE